MNGLGSVRRRGVKCAALCCAMAAPLVALLSGGPALAASSGTVPDYVGRAAASARTMFARGDVEWAVSVVSTPSAVGPVFGLTSAQTKWLPAAPPAYLVYLVVMKGEFSFQGSTGSYLRFVVYQRDGTTVTSTLFVVSTSSPAMGGLGSFEKISLPSYFWQQVRSNAGYALVLGVPLLLLVVGGFVGWSRSRWWVAGLGAGLALALAGAGAWLAARSWPPGELSSFAYGKLAGVAVVGALCLAGAATATRTGFVVRRGGAVERTLSVRQASAILLVLAVIAYFLALPFLGTTGE